MSFSGKLQILPENHLELCNMTADENPMIDDQDMLFCHMALEKDTVFFFHLSD